ncbi:Membrane protein [Yarrowia sp. B02]|nr:Membrane protein [Yarrowia sp. B02]
MVPLFLALVALLATFAHCESTYWASPAVEQNCFGIYASRDHPGSISVSTPKLENSSVINFMGHEGWMALAIYKYDDLPFIGDMGRKEWGYKYHCNSMNVQYKLCSHDEIGQYIVKDNYTGSTIFTTKVDLLEDTTFTYSVNETGFYCVTAHPNNEMNKFESVLTVKNGYGELSGYDYNKLAFHGAMTGIWGAVLIAYSALCFVRKNLLPVHKRLLMLVGVNVLVMLMWTIYNAIYNGTGPTTFVKVLVVNCAVFSAFRWSLSFYTALYIAYGMHYFSTPLIQSAQKKGIAVTATFFGFFSLVSSMLYLIGMVQGTYVRMGIGACLCFVLYGVLYIFYNIYSWNKHTQKSYVDENMSVQIQQITRLNWVYFSFLLVFGFMILFNIMILLRGSIVGSTLNLIQTTNVAWVNEWKYRWFFVHDWIEVANLLVVMAALWILRPSRYFNQMMDGSGQISQNDYDEFELDEYDENDV